MNQINEPKIGTAEKVTRFVCGTVLGTFVAVYFLAKFAVESWAAAAAIWAGAMLVCGGLALKYGDEFWYALFGRGR